VGTSRNSKRSCLWVGLGLSAVLLVVVLVYGILESVANRSSCDDVLQEFAKFMRQNKEEAARSLTASEQWNRIDTWMAGREGIDCSFSLEPDHNRWWWGLVPCSGVEGTLCSDFGFMCTYKNGVYRLTITDVRLRDSEGTCIVVGWDKVCESGLRDGKDSCK